MCLPYQVESRQQQQRCISDEKVEQVGITMSKLPIMNSLQSPVIDGYTTRGFNINGNKVFGSIALLPRAYFHWKIVRPDEITPESLTLFHIVRPRIELVVLGTGVKIKHVSRDVREFLRGKGIALEIQDTHNACGTFHCLMDEGRMAGAALIPPEY
ncbi:NADH dehydrogenase [ubiquinone] 1 alpha subcomplex assembly factor 3-like isoform X2 [Dysidea avara]|uniref:NADH dehydrogenase [ubiquinone] 1 alpha subcomplex assembly factor 3-like isoform X2 n=1 Tax=Dysidea avara TaxID=196820 RepID=UPI00331EBDCE